MWRKTLIGKIIKTKCYHSKMPGFHSIHKEKVLNFLIKGIICLDKNLPEGLADACRMESKNQSQGKMLGGSRKEEGSRK